MVRRANTTIFNAQSNSKTLPGFRYLRTVAVPTAFPSAKPISWTKTSATTIAIMKQFEKQKRP